jgi:hypothetical protein
MASYVGPARLVVDGAVHDVAVNLHSFVDLRERPEATGPGSAWRGVVVDAAFVPRGHEGRPAEVRLPDGRGGAAILIDRRLEGQGSGPL